MTAVELIRHLHLEAEELRKQKKRQNVTGLHKSVLHVTFPHSTSFVNTGSKISISQPHKTFVFKARTNFKDKKPRDCLD